MPTNTTGLSLSGVLKWFAIILSGVFLFKAFQGIFLKEGATGGERNVGVPLSGHEAVVWGLGNLGYAVLMAAIAWALWFFWQRNED